MMQAVSSSGSIFISRRPNPCRSGYDGCAPTFTPCFLARRTVFRMTTGSEAWNPQATFATVM